jgi:hypothetical protein
MGLVLRLVETGAESRAGSVDVLEIDPAGDLRDIANLGLTLAEAKQLLARVQQAVVAVQARDQVALRPECSGCGGRCQVKDRRSRRIATLFGKVTVRLPRFCCSACGRVETGVGWPAHCRSTPALDQLQAHLSALMTYRVAAGVLAHLLPVAAGTSPETLRSHTLTIGEALRRAATVAPEPAVVAAAPASAITLSLDSTYIRSRHAGERHLEVRVGNAEASEGGRQVFGAVANAGTDIVALIRRALDTLGRTGDTELTAFTDGCPGLRAILAAAGVASPPIADWFHLATRLQHAKQVAVTLPADEPDRAQAKAAVVAEVERLRWRTWNGKARDARITLKRLRTLLPALEREPVRKLRRALRAIDRYLRGQSAWLVNYAERHRAGLRVGTSLTEGTANFLVNRRMAKSQQMRWSRRGVDLLLQVRCAVHNGALGSSFGTLFEPTPSSGLHWAEAA